MKYAMVSGVKLVSIGEVADALVDDVMVPVIPPGTVALSDAEYAAIESESSGAAAIIAAVVARAAA